MTYEKEFEFAKSMAQKAGQVMKKYYRQDQSLYYKDGDHRSPVTVADIEINQEVINNVKATFPDHGVRGEEASENIHADNLWVVDPIDGTRMYSHHIPTSMFSLAYVVNGDTKVAVCFNPWTNDMYTAVRSEGAFRNNEPIKVQDINDEVSVGVWLLKNTDHIQKIWHLDMVPIMIYPMVMKGCLVAEGSLSAAYAYPGVGTHDIAATSLLIEEAGGVVTDIDGKSQKYNQEVSGVIMGRPDVMDIMKKIL